MEFLLALIEEYGYALIFLWTLFEGETIVALAGFAAYQGYLRVEYILPVAIVGAMIGDHAFFFFGRYKGREFLAKHPRVNAKVERIHLLLERHHGWIIFGSRFMYGFRTIIPISLGVSRVNAWMFFGFNFLGAVVWGILFVFGGYVFGGAIEYFLGNMRKIEIFLASLATIVILAQLAMWWGRRRNARLLALLNENDPRGTGRPES